MKRVVSSSIITLLILLAVAAAFIYLRNFRSEGGNPVQAIPSDAAFFVVYNPDSISIENFTKLQFWQSFQQAPAFRSLKKTLYSLDSASKANETFRQFFSASPVFVSAHVTSANAFDFLFLKSMNGNFTETSIDKLIPEVMGINAVPTQRNYDGNMIRELQVGDNRIFTYCVAKGIFMGSYTSFVVEDALRQLKVGKPVIDDYSKLSGKYNEAGFNLFLNFNNISSLLNIFTDAEKVLRLANLPTFGKWAVAGSNFSNDQFLFNGILTNTDTTFQSSCFKGQQPVSRKLLRILPGKTAHVHFIGLSDFSSYYKKLSRNFLSSDKNSPRKNVRNQINAKFKIDIEEKMLEWIGNEYALVITEPSGVGYENNCYAVFGTQNIKKAKSSLLALSKIVDRKSGSVTMEEVYNEYSIGLIRLNNVLPSLFGDIFNKVPGLYYTAVGDYIVFANKASSLRAFIDDHKSESLLVNSSYYKSLQRQLPASGNIFYMVRPGASFYIFKSLANSEWKGYADSYRDVISSISTIGFQMSADESLLKFDACVNFSNTNISEGVNSVFTVETDSSVTSKPLLTTDPITKSRQLLFQDNAEVLYLSDNSGNLIWKQQMTGGGIMGEIHEIDLFKNNSRQFLFNTREYLYLLDLEGKPVGNYPIRLPAPATNGVTVYDFDDRNEPRIYVACENGSVYAYLPSGRPLPGWVFRERTGKVSEPLKPVRIGGKTCLLISDETGSVYIVNRFGEAAVPVTGKTFAGINTSFYSDTSGVLIFTDSQGNVVKINPSGSIETIPLNIAGDAHGFLYSDTDADGEPDYVFVNNSELVSYNSSLVMIYRKVFEYDLSGEIQLFTLKSGEKVMGLRSVAADRTWLVKMNGSVMEGFPVKGSGPAVMDELNLDGTRNLFVGGNDNRFYVYSIE